MTEKKLIIECIGFVWSIHCHVYTVGRNKLILSNKLNTFRKSTKAFHIMYRSHCGNVISGIGSGTFDFRPWLRCCVLRTQRLTSCINASEPRLTASLSSRVYMITWAMQGQASNFHAVKFSICVIDLENWWSKIDSPSAIDITANYTSFKVKDYRSKLWIYYLLLSIWTSLDEGAKSGNVTTLMLSESWKLWRRHALCLSRRSAYVQSYCILGFPFRLLSHWIMSDKWMDVHKVVRINVYHSIHLGRSWRKLAIF